MDSTTFNGSLIKTGFGTWTLDQPFSYSGSTTVNAGTLQLSVGTASNILPTGTALVLGGGTLGLTGTGTQIVVGLTTTANTASAIVLAASETLTLGALTSIGAHSALNFNTAAGGAAMARRWARA